MLRYYGEAQTSLRSGGDGCSQFDLPIDLKPRLAKRRPARA
jgi:hypothetical protein